MKVQLTYKQIWQIAYPMMISGVTQNIINVTDTAFLGRVGEVELGASAIAGVFYFAMVMIGFGFTLGAQILIARRLGEGKPDDVGKIIDHQLIILSILATFIFAFMFFFSRTLLKYLVKSEEIYFASITFIDFRAWGIFFSFLSFLFRAFYLGIGRTQIIIWSTAVTALVNIILDYLLIFGYYGFPKMGIGGAALASVIAEIAGVLVVVLNVYHKRLAQQYLLFSFSKIDFSLIKKISSLSTPMVFQYFISLASWFLFFVMIERMGEHELAISNILRSIYMAYMIPTWGFASATNTMVSNVIGQEKHDEVMKMVRKIASLSFLTSFALCLTIIFFPKPIISFYTNDQMLIDDSVAVLFVLIPILILFSTSTIFFNSVTGSGGTRYSLMSETIAVSAYLVYIACSVFVFHWGLVSAWGSELLYWMILIVMAYYYLHREKWKDISL